MEYAVARRARRLRGRVAGGEPPRPRGDGADGGVRRGHRADRRSAPASSTTGRATSACSPRRSRRSTTSRPGAIKLGIGAWWEPLASKVGIDRRRPLLGDARDGRGSTPAARDGARHLPRRVRPPRRRRDRHRPRRPLAEARADLHRRDRHEDDGARRRDRRRRPAQLPRRPGVQQERDGGARRSARSAPAAPSTTSTGRSSSSARSTPTARSRSTARASSSRSTSASSRTS